MALPTPKAWHTKTEAAFLTKSEVRKAAERARVANPGKTDKELLRMSSKPSTLATPKAWSTPIKATTPEKAGHKITARIDMSAEVAGAGLCPECRQPMDRSFANGIECWVCHSDRIAIPLPDVTAAPEAVQPGVEDYAAFGPTTSQGPV